MENLLLLLPLLWGLLQLLPHGVYSYPLEVHLALYCCCPSAVMQGPAVQLLLLLKRAL
jgi:hypothetical protein